MAEGTNDRGEACLWEGTPSLVCLIARAGDDAARRVGPNLGSDLMVGYNTSFTGNLRHQCLAPVCRHPARCGKEGEHLM